MMTKSKFQIGEIAELLQINRSKLRFWEQQGLLQLERTTENNYRQYSFFDILHITDIMFYRNLHFSTKELQELFQLSPYALEQELAQKEQEVEYHMQELQQIQKGIRLRRESLREAEELKRQPYQQQHPEVQFIRPIQEENLEEWRKSLFFPEKTIYVKQDLDSALRCYFPAENTGYALWQEEDTTVYVTALLRFYVLDESQNNLKDHVNQLQAMGWRTGKILFRYLYTAMEDGVHYDYYKGWIEVFPLEEKEFCTSKKEKNEKIR